MEKFKNWLYHALLEQKTMEKVINPFVIVILFTGALFPMIMGWWTPMRIACACVFLLMSIIESLIWKGTIKVSKWTTFYRMIAFTVFPVYEVMKIVVGGGLFEYCDFLSVFLLPSLEVLLNALEQYHKNES